MTSKKKAEFKKLPWSINYIQPSFYKKAFAELDYDWDLIHRDMKIMTVFIVLELLAAILWWPCWLGFIFLSVRHIMHWHEFLGMTCEFYENLQIEKQVNKDNPNSELIKLTHDEALDLMINGRVDHKENGIEYLIR